MPKVRLENVTKQFGKVTAVSDLSMEIRDGELLALVGPSGCGKSTVLRLVAGLEEPSSGNIYIDGRLVNGVPPRERNIAMVFESPHHGLYPNMTVYDNMAFGLRMSKEPLEPEAAGDDRPDAEDMAGAPAEVALGRTRKQSEREAGIRKRVDRLAGKLGLRPYLERRRDELSAGHSQSVALGRALARQAKVILMDDPLSQLDAHMGADRRAELRRLHNETGATILYVTHDQADAVSLGNRIAVMDNGVLQQLGTAQGLYEYPANMFVAGFIGSPGMNLLPVEVGGPGNTLLSGRGFTVSMPEQYAERLLGNTRIVLGLRPEHIQDAQHVPDADPGTVVNAEVALVENTGSDLYVHLAVGGGPTFVAHLKARVSVRAGERMDVVFDTANMRAFDPVSGRSLL